jgi:restriction system protein
MSKPIHQVAVDVIRLQGRPMTIQEIYEYIVQKQLYSFKAKSPLQVLRAQIRRHCQGFELPNSPARKYFKLTEDGGYDILAGPAVTRDGL